MVELGIIKNVNNDGIATVRVMRSEACGDCKACEIGKSDAKFVELLVKNNVNAKAGDQVSIEMQTQDVLKAALIMYGIPLFAMMASMCVSYFVVLPENQPAAAITGLAFAMISFIVIRLNEDRIKRVQGFYPKLLSIENEIDKELSEKSLL